MRDLFDYVKSTFNYGVDVDAKQFSTATPLMLLEEKVYYVYVTPVYFENLEQDDYFELVEDALEKWSCAIDKKIKFEIVETTQFADIKVYWRRDSYCYWGMQYQEKLGNKNIMGVTIGVVDKQEKIVPLHRVHAVIVHEFGHVMKLGHSTIKGDIMTTGDEFNTTISENDKFVLNLIYSIGSGYSYDECARYIEDCILEYKKIPRKQEPQNMREQLDTIATINKFNLISPNIDIQQLFRL